MYIVLWYVSANTESALLKVGPLSACKGARLFVAASTLVSLPSSFKCLIPSNIVCMEQLAQYC